MAINSNKLVKFLVPVTLLVALVIGVRSCSHNRRTAEQPQPASLPSLTPEQLRELGIEGDTPQDTLNTLVAKLGDIRQQQALLEKQNRKLKKQNEQLQSQFATNTTDGVSLTEETEKALLQRQQELQQELNELKSTLQNNINNSSSVLPVLPDIPVGNATENTTWNLNTDYQWVTPQNMLPTATGNTTATGININTPFGMPESGDLSLVHHNGKSTGRTDEEALTEPVYTLPQNSTLTGSRAMTALLGRIPVDGKVVDPYPFKILIGKDNLTANGIELPDVDGAVISGTATGDWTLSCVRGKVNSITFVFADGSISSYPAVTKDNGTQSQDAEGIGWLSDSSGIPCISGERKSNAASYLPTIGLLALGTSAGDALSASQYTNQAENGSITSALSGSAGKAVLGQALGGSFREVAQWVKSRYGQTFDAIYVPPGASVAVHLTREIDIDYEKKGRRVKYTGFTLPESPLSTDTLD